MLQGCVPFIDVREFPAEICVLLQYEFQRSLKTSLRSPTCISPEKPRPRYRLIAQPHEWKVKLAAAEVEDGTAIFDFGSGQLHFPLVRLRD
ncbi:MAG: hypothetical protein EOP84_37190 [Verrucomicrobiaceae bacterium]|nr:MAG: hypothetical protein EOP84_37190 [Verrucomicrobiaceae bacterium]